MMGLATEKQSLGERAEIARGSQMAKVTKHCSINNSVGKTQVFVKLLYE